MVLGNDPYGDPHRTLISGRVTPADGMDDEGWKVLAEGYNYVARRVMDEAGHPDRRPPAHRHLGRDRGRGPAPVRHDRPVRPGPVPGHRATGPSVPAATRSPPSASSATASGTSTSRTATRPSPRPRAPTAGPARSPSAMACSASWARAPSTSRACSRRSTTSATAGWIVVEQDVLPGMGNPRESARRNREYLRSLGRLAFELTRRAARRPARSHSRRSPWVTRSGSASWAPAGGPTRCTCPRSRDTRRRTSARSWAGARKHTREFAARWGVPAAYDSFDGDARRRGLDAVMILAPNVHHHPTRWPRSSAASTSCARSRWA